MTKKEKREQKRRKRWVNALDKVLGGVSIKCDNCGKMCSVLPIDSGATCTCGAFVSRYSNRRE